jgi:hypothetical protein
MISDTKGTPEAVAPLDIPQRLNNSICRANSPYLILLPDSLYDNVLLLLLHTIQSNGAREPGHFTGKG